jgi:hypothetical protein
LQLAERRGRRVDRDQAPRARRAYAGHMAKSEIHTFGMELEQQEGFERRRY